MALLGWIAEALRRDRLHRERIREARRHREKLARPTATDAARLNKAVAEGRVPRRGGTQP